MTVLLVLVGGALGAPVRYVVDLMVQSRHDSVLPWGTLAVNAAGSLVLGATAGGVAAAGGPHWLLTLVGTGFCGALTTFSTLQLELLRMLDGAHYALAAAYAIVSVVAGLAAITLATKAAQA